MCSLAFSGKPEREDNFHPFHFYLLLLLSFVHLLAYQGIADGSDDFLLVCSGDRLLKEFGVPFLASVKVARDLDLDWRERKEFTLYGFFFFFFLKFFCMKR